MSAIIPIQQYKVYLASWGVWLTAIATEKGVYHVIREVCEALGISDHRTQYNHLKAHPDACNFIERLSVETENRGRQSAYCVHNDVLGSWLYMVSPRLIRPEFRARLTEFHRDTRFATKRVLMGEVDGTLSNPGDQSATIINLADYFGKSRDPIQLSPSSDDDE